MITLNEFKKVLKSKKFESKIEDSDESHLFTFTEAHMFRDNKPLCDYDLIEDGNGFRFIFLRKYQDFSTVDFKNIIFSVPDDHRFPLIVNWNGSDIQMGKGLNISVIARSPSEK